LTVSRLAALAMRASSDASQTPDRFMLKGCAGR
jgi:hypothetical protein